MNNQPTGLVLSGVSKRFGATRALIDGDLHLRPGEIHTLLGRKRLREEHTREDHGRRPPPGFRHTYP